MCNKLIFTQILILAVITASQASTSSLLSFLERPKPAAYAKNPCAEKQNGQFVCLDCSTLAYCVQEGGSWVTIEVAPCPTERSMYCNEDTKSCVLQRECFLPKQGVAFECQNPGKYPDPYDCKVYHVCSSLNVDTRMVCPSGLIYSPAAMECQQRTSDNDVCSAVQYYCEYPGMMGSWPGDDNIYYICHVKNVDGEFMYYPLMYRCQTGNVFDGKKCVPATETQQPTQPPKQSTNAPVDGPVGTCIENTYSANPTNCRAYYRCKNGKQIAEQCPTGTIYDAKGGYCTFGNC